jgi:uncharacterized cupin superfamily protein
MPLSSIIRLEPNGPRGELELRPAVGDLELVSCEPPIQRGYRFLEDTQRGVFMSVWDSTPINANFALKTEPFPRHEFFWVVDGSVIITDAAGRVDTFRAGDCFVFPQGFIHQWKQTEYFRKYAVGFTDASAPEPADAVNLKVVRVDLNGPLDKIAGPAAQSLLGPAPVQHERQCFVDPTGQMAVRVWDTTACHTKPRPTGRHEWMHILDGSVTLTDEAGEAHRFKTGDSFGVPFGTVCGWQCDAYLRALRCSFEPKTAAAVQAAE